MASNAGSFGAGGLMRQPTRLDESRGPTTKCSSVETDAGQQTRLFRFGESRRPRRVSAHWQGDSVAEWIGIAPPVSRTVWIQRSGHRAYRRQAGSPGRRGAGQRGWTVRPHAEPRRAQLAPSGALSAGRQR